MSALYSPDPFSLGNFPSSPQLATNTAIGSAYAYNSPMARLLTNHRSSPKFSHVNPHAQGTNNAGHMFGSSMSTINALTSMFQLHKNVDEALANIKGKLNALKDSDLRTDFVATPHTHR